MTNILKPVLFSMTLALAPVMMATEPIEIYHPEIHTTMARLNQKSKYALLPIQESSPMSAVKVYKDGKVVKRLNANLAHNRIDYYVPIDLESLGEGKIFIEVNTPLDRSYQRESSDGIWAKEIKLSDNFDTANTEKFRPIFHHTPVYGWMNDPNGMFYKDGVWHLCYQYNPYGSKWQNMAWGHSTSKDLVNWEHQPLLLETNDLGMIFSGSAAVDKNNTAGFGKDAVIALYTSAGNAQVQSMAYSTDDFKTLTNYEGNPIIVYNRESRDPNMFWDEESGKWILLLAAALDKEMLIFSSDNLKEWKLESKFGHGYGAQDGVWECPDMLKLPVKGTDEEKWVLICNINPGGPWGGSATQYFVGDFDGKTFTCIDSPEVTKWMDYGKDLYATVSFSNAPEGRHTMIGWMSNWQYANDVPTKQFRSANSLPRDVSLFKGPDGSYYMASVPSPEVDAMRGKVIKHGATSLSVSPKTYKLPTANDGICEIVFNVEAKDDAIVNLTLANTLRDDVIISINTETDSISFDRRKSGITAFSEHFPGVTVAPMYQGNNKNYSVRIFVDRSSIEIFDADGKYTLTNLVFPNEPYSTLRVYASKGKARMTSMEIYPINVK